MSVCVVIVLCDVFIDRYTKFSHILLRKKIALSHIKYIYGMSSTPIIIISKKNNFMDNKKSDLYTKYVILLE